MAGTDQDDIAALGSDQSHASQNERAHEDFTQLGIGLDNRAKILVVDGEDLAFLADAGAHHAGDAAQRTHLSGKLARRVHNDRHFTDHAGTHDLDASREDDEKSAVTFARLRQYFAPERAHPLPVRLEAGDLRGAQPGKGLFPAGLDGIGRRGFPAIGLPAHPSSMSSWST